MTMESNETERKDTDDAGVGESESKPQSRRLPVWMLAAVGLIVIIVLAVVLTGGSSPNGGSGLTVSIDAPAEVSAGGELTVRVAVGEVVDFDSANYDITYDSDVLEVTGVGNGSIGNTTIPILNWNFDQSKVRVINNVPGLPGVNGSGYLAEVYFNVVGSSGDSSDLKFDGSCVLYTIEVVQIEAQWADGSVRVK